MSDIKKVTVTLRVDGKLLFGTNCGGAVPYDPKYFMQTISDEVNQFLNKPDEGIQIVGIQQGIDHSKDDRIKELEDAVKHLTDLSDLVIYNNNMMNVALLKVAVVKYRSLITGNKSQQELEDVTEKIVKMESFIQKIQNSFKDDVHYDHLSKEAGKIINLI